MEFLSFAPANSLQMKRCASSELLLGRGLCNSGRKGFHLTLRIGGFIITLGGKGFIVTLGMRGFIVTL
jgi:hypothetical protein